MWYQNLITENVTDEGDDEAYYEMVFIYESTRSDIEGFDSFGGWSKGTPMYEVYMKYLSATKLLEEVWAEICKVERNGTKDNHPNAAETIEENAEMLFECFEKITNDEITSLKRDVFYSVDSYDYEEVWNNASPIAQQSALTEYQACKNAEKECAEALSQEFESNSFDFDQAYERIKTFSNKFAAAYYNLYNKIHAYTEKPVTTLPKFNYYYYDVNGNGKMNCFYRDNKNYALAQINEQGYWTTIQPLWIEDKNKSYNKAQYSDLNGDGLIDFVAQDDNGHNCIICLGQSNNDYKVVGHSTCGVYQFMDFNNDGRENLFIYNHKEDGLEPSYNNTLTPIPQERLSVGELKVIDPTKLEAENWGGGLVQSANNVLYGGWMISSTKPWSNVQYFGNGQLQAIDFNGDGITDYMDYSTGTCFVHTGNSLYARTQLGGNVIMRDFNGDGLMDFVVYDSEAKSITCYLVNTDGTLGEGKTLYRGFECGLHIWCYDFNRDGAPDVLIPFNYSKNAGSYLLLLENKGDGTFKKHETFIQEQAEFAECIDIDADGNYEVLAYCKNNQATDTQIYDLKAFKVQGTKVPETGTLIINKVQYNANIPVGNFDNTGVMQANVKYSDEKYGEKTIALSEKVNQRPQAPAAPTFFFDVQTGNIKINWSNGSDNETPTADLTYELRIGTAPGKGDIVYAHALADGRRRNLQNGKQGHTHQCIFDTRSWPAGEIYIAVQTIDANHLGSPFSAETVLKKQIPASMFCAEYPDQLGLGDEIKLTLLTPAEQGVSYQWDLGEGATILKQNADNTELTVVYNVPGEKNITLNAIGHITGQYTTTLFVSSTNVKTATESIISSTENINDLDKINFAADIDLDGKNEFFVKYKSENKNLIGFFSAQADGKYSPIKKLWNNRFNQYYKSSIVLADVNHDGLPDLCYNNIDDFQNSTSFYLINNGKLDFDEDLNDIMPGANFQYNYIDINNDGLLDYAKEYAGEFYLNKGNGVFEKTFDMNKQHSFGLWVDHNHDGLIDFLTKDREIWLNNGDGSFTNTHITLPTTSHAWDAALFCSGDFDGDGILDFLVDTRTTYNPIGQYQIEWGDGTITSLKDLFLEMASNFSYIAADFDNDGNIEIRIPGKRPLDEKSGIYQMKIQKDKTLSVERLSKSEEFSGINDHNVLWRDCNGKTHITGYTPILTASNEKPLPPTNLRSTQTEKGVMLEWNHSVDKETPTRFMRYIVSVKHKGKEGEGAYIISPMNGGKNGIPVATCQRLVDSNRFLIPISIIPSGEYEVKVQGVDLWQEPSDFSEVYYMNVTDAMNMDMPASTVVGEETAIRQLSNADLQTDWSGGTVTHREGSTHYVVWNSEGLKQIRIGQQTYNIYVYARPDASFTLPKKATVGDRIHIEGENMEDCQWSVRLWADDASHRLTITPENDNKAIMIFNHVGEYTITRTVEAHGVSVTNTQIIQVTETQSPTISLVDMENNYHRVNWKVSAAPITAKALRLYRETTKKGQYTLVGTYPLTDGSYTDLQSNPSVTSSTYTMSYELSYGESALSTPHTTMHASVNVGTSNSWNLIWTPYEGTEISTYRILRGTTEENLTLLAEVSGTARSYSDYTAIKGTDYLYAVEIIPQTTSAKSNAQSSCSNVVSTRQAQNAVLATALEVISITGTTIDAEHLNAQLAAILTPYYTSIATVAWSIVEGADKATVDSYGTVTPTGVADGQIVVRASTIDGSNLTADITLTLSGVTGIKAPDITTGSEITIDYDRPTKSLTVSTQRKAVVNVYSLDGFVHSRHNCAIGITTIDCTSWPANIYVIAITNGRERKSIKITIQ